jgi:hypothetical protein
MTQTQNRIAKRKETAQVSQIRKAKVKAKEQRDVEMKEKYA